MVQNIYDGACREVLLSSVNVGVLASLFTFGAAPRPSNLGLQDIGTQLADECMSCSLADCVTCCCNS